MFFTTAKNKLGSPAHSDIGHKTYIKSLMLAQIFQFFNFVYLHINDQGINIINVVDISVHYKKI